MKTKLIKIGSYHTMYAIEFEVNNWIALHSDYDVIDIKIVPYCDAFALFSLVKYKKD